MHAWGHRLTMQRDLQQPVEEEAGHEGDADHGGQ